MADQAKPYTDEELANIRENPQQRWRVAKGGVVALMCEARWLATLSAAVARAEAAEDEHARTMKAARDLTESVRNALPGSAEDGPMPRRVRALVARAEHAEARTAKVVALLKEARPAAARPYHDLRRNQENHAHLMRRYDAALEEVTRE